MYFLKYSLNCVFFSVSWYCLKRCHSGEREGGREGSRDPGRDRDWDQDRHGDRNRPRDRKSSYKVRFSQENVTGNFSKPGFPHGKATLCRLDLGIYSAFISQHVKLPPREAVVKLTEIVSPQSFQSLRSQGWRWATVSWDHSCLLGQVALKHPRNR